MRESVKWPGHDSLEVAGHDGRWRGEDAAGGNLRGRWNMGTLWGAGIDILVVGEMPPGGGEQGK